MNKNKKALVVTTVASTIDQFCMNDILILRNYYDVQVAANFIEGNNTSKERISTFKNELINKQISINEIEFDRNPLSIKNIVAYKKLKELMRHNKFELVHCHTPVAAMLTRLAAKSTRKNGTMVIYTAHGFHFYNGAPLKNWLVYYFVEKWLTKYTDVIITINKEDYQRAKSKFRVNKIEYVPGIGVDLSKFNSIQIDRNLKRSELGLPNSAFVILSVGELNKNKNHEVVIRAISKMKNIQNVHYIICGQGQLDEYLSELCKNLSLDNQVHFLGFRKDVAEIYKISNIFVFPSFREGLSVALMEAMANGLPVVCSNIRGNKDLIDEGFGGYLIDSTDINGYRSAILSLINNKDNYKLGLYNQKKIINYDKIIISNIMRNIYTSLLET